MRDSDSKSPIAKDAKAQRGDFCQDAVRVLFHSWCPSDYPLPELMPWAMFFGANSRRTRNAEIGAEAQIERGLRNMKGTGTACKRTIYEKSHVLCTQDLLQEAFHPYNYMNLSKQIWCLHVWRTKRHFASDGSPMDFPMLEQCHPSCSVPSIVSAGRSEIVVQFKRVHCHVG